MRRKLMSLFVASLLVIAMTVAACGLVVTPQTSQPTHKCESVCPECGLCLDEDCAADVCKDKCPGHGGPSTPTHECESVCEECGLCTDTECTDPACADKCQGHEPVEHECESVCPECGLCLDAYCEEEACAENCPGHQEVHECESECPKCGLCTDKYCEEDACLEKCEGHPHECEHVCPDCGRCTNDACEEEVCEEKCQKFNVTLVKGATFANGETSATNVCALPNVTLEQGKEFEGFIDAEMNYYTIEELKDGLNANLELTAIYQEDMLAYAQSDTAATGVSGVYGEHIYEDGIYKTQVTFKQNTVAGTWFAGRGNHDSQSMPEMNIYAPAYGKNVAVIYIFNHASVDVPIKYMVENYGDQGSVEVTLAPGLNKFGVTFGGVGSHPNFYTSDHQIILQENATEDIVLDTYGYVYVDHLISGIRVTSTPSLVYEEGKTDYDWTGLGVSLILENFESNNFYIHNYDVRVNGKTAVVSYGEYTASFIISDSDATDMITYTPSTGLGDPEGPNGAHGNMAGAYPNNTGMTAEYVTLEGGIPATKFTFPAGSTALSGRSILENNYPTVRGAEGNNCAIPVVANTNKVVKLHLTNNGTE